MKKEIQQLEARLLGDWKEEAGDKQRYSVTPSVTETSQVFLRQSSILSVTSTDDLIPGVAQAQQPDVDEENIPNIPDIDLGKLPLLVFDC